MNVRSKRNLEKYKNKICKELTTEKYTVPEICNKYKIEKGGLIKAIQQWKSMGYIAKDVKLQFNPNRGPGVNKGVVKETNTVLNHNATDCHQRQPFWWEEVGVKIRPNEGTFEYDDEHSIRKLEHSRFLIYTDGSCLFAFDKEEKTGAGGWAVICLDRESPETKERFGYEIKATPIQMELKAIEEGLLFIPEGESATIFTDSKNAITIIQNLERWKNRGWRDDFDRTPANLNILLNIFELMGKRSVTIQWVKGHNSDPMNTRCDELARDAANRQLSSSEPVDIPVINVNNDSVNAEAEKDMEEKSEMSLADAAKMVKTVPEYLRQLAKKGFITINTGVRPATITLEEVNRIKESKEKYGSFTGNPYRNQAWHHKKDVMEKLPETIGIVLKKETEADEVVTECTDEEKLFMEMYFRYGADAAATDAGITPKEAESKWRNLLIKYDVRLDIRKK